MAWRSKNLAALSVLIALASCRSLQDARQIEANILAPGNFRTGAGQIVSVGALAGEKNVYRITLQMQNGSFQSVDVDDGTFMAGETVELTNDGRAVRATGTSLNRLIRKQ